MPPQHIIIRPPCFLLFTLSVSHFYAIFFPSLPLSFFFSFWSPLCGCLPACPPVPPPPSNSPPPAFVLLLPRHFLPLPTLFRICHLLKSFRLFPSPPPPLSTMHRAICPTTFLFSPTNIYLLLILPASPHGTCLILLVAGLLCHSSRALSPSSSSLLGSFCPGSLTVVGAYATKQLSPAHRGVSPRMCVCVRVCTSRERERERACKYIFWSNGKSVCVGVCVSLCAISWFYQGVQLLC